MDIATINVTLMVGEIFTNLWTTLEESYGPAGPFYAVAALGMLLALVARGFRDARPISSRGSNQTNNG